MVSFFQYFNAIIIISAKNIYWTTNQETAVDQIKLRSGVGNMFGVLWLLKCSWSSFSVWFVRTVVGVVTCLATFDKPKLFLSHTPLPPSPLPQTFPQKTETAVGIQKFTILYVCGKVMRTSFLVAFFHVDCCIQSEFY